MDRREKEYYVDKICKNRDKCFLPDADKEDYIKLLAINHILWYQNRTEREYDLECLNKYKCPPPSQYSYFVLSHNSVIYIDNNVHELTRILIPHHTLVEQIIVPDYISYDLIPSTSGDLITLYVDTNLITQCSDYNFTAQVVGACTTIEIPISFRACYRLTRTVFDELRSCCDFPLNIAVPGICATQSGSVFVVQTSDSTTFSWAVHDDGVLTINLNGSLVPYYQNGDTDITLIIQDVRTCDENTTNLTVNLRLVDCNYELKDYCCNIADGCDCYGKYILFRPVNCINTNSVMFTVRNIIGNISENVYLNDGSVLLNCDGIVRECSLGYVYITFDSCCGTKTVVAKVAIDDGSCINPIVRFNIANGTDLNTLTIPSTIATVNCEGRCITTFNIVATITLYCDGTPQHVPLPVVYDHINHIWNVIYDGNGCSPCSPADGTLEIYVYNCNGKLLAFNNIQVVCR